MTRRGVTLVEVLVVVAVVGALVAVAVPAVQKVRAAAARAGCQNNLKQVALGVHGFHGRTGGLPPRPFGDFRDPNSTLSRLGLVLPDVGQGPLWAATVAAYRADSRPWRNPPHVGLVTPVPVFSCPADGRLAAPLAAPAGVPFGGGSYVAVSGGQPNRVDGALGPQPGVRLADIIDGTANTLLVAERPPPDSGQAGRWYTGSVDSRWGDHLGPDDFMDVVGTVWGDDPECAGTPAAFGFGRLDNPCDRYHFWSLHPGGANFAFADGSVKFIKDAIAPRVWVALHSISAGDVVGSDSY